MSLPYAMKLNQILETKFRFGAITRVASLVSCSNSAHT